MSTTDKPDCLGNDEDQLIDRPISGQSLLEAGAARETDGGRAILFGTSLAQTEKTLFVARSAHAMAAERRSQRP